MAATYTTELLSGSTDGRLIAIGQTVTLGDVLHTASGVANVIDQIWLEAANTSIALVDLTIEWGGVTAADLIKVSLQPKAGLFIVVNGLPLANGLIVRAFASVGSVVNIGGWVNRRTP